MHLVLIRHGEPDYGDVEERRYIGHGRDLAKLSDTGIAQAERVSKDRRLEGAQVILSSPYTRALQTAAVISKNTGLDIVVETDLHEWMPDTTFQYAGLRDLEEIDLEMRAHKGERTADCIHHWESLSDLGRRVFGAIRKHLNYDRAIVVCHGYVIRQFVCVDEIPLCGISEYDFRDDSRWNGWVEGV